MERSHFSPVLCCVTILILFAVAHAAEHKPPKGKKSPPPPPPKAPKAPPSPKGPKSPPRPPKPLAVKCLLKKYFPHCTQQLTCPHNCPRSCYVDCQRCAPVCVCYGPGGVCEDPRFVGGDGITFYFHGKKDRDFCLLTDSDFHINAHFIGKRSPSRPRDYTWVQSIAVLFGKNTLFLGARKTATWDDSDDRIVISHDGFPIELANEEGATWQSSEGPSTMIVRTSDANAVTVEVEGRFKITARVVPITEEESRVHNYGLTGDDCFAHLELGFKFYSLTKDVHGVLGQTYREGYVSRVKISAAMPIMGGDHLFSTSDLYAPDCAVARFGKGEIGGAAMESELGEVRCASGMSGSGIVCKK